MSNRINPRSTKKIYIGTGRTSANVDNLIASLQAENQRLRTERNAAQASLRNIGIEHHAAKSEANELRAIRDKQQAELVAAADLNRRVTDSRDGWIATVSAANARLRESEDENKALKATTDEQQKALNSLSDQLSAARAELKSVASARDTYKNAAEATSEDYERVCRELRKLKDRPDQSRAISNLEQEVRTLRSQLVKSNEAYSRRCAEAIRLTDQLRAMTDSARSVEQERIDAATAATVQAQVLAELQRVQREVLALVEQMREKKIIVMNLYASRIEAAVLENMTAYPPEEQPAGCDCGPREGCPDCCDFTG